MKNNFSLGDYFEFKLINIKDLLKNKDLKENKIDVLKDNNNINNINKSDIKNSDIKNSDNKNFEIKNNDIKKSEIKNIDKKLLTSNKKQDDLNTINNDNNENDEKNKITIIYPLSGKIISEEEFNSINTNFNKKENENQNTNNKTINNNHKKKFSHQISNNYKKRLFSEINKNNNNNNNNNINGCCIKESELKKYLNLSFEELNKEIENFRKLIDIEENDENYENEIDKYIKLEEKWRIIAQDSIFQLLEIFPTDSNYNKNTIKNVIDSFHIDKDLIKYDEENDTFYD